MRRLVVGDIHGCYIEFMELLDKAALSAEDEIIALGDILDRGPDSRRVLEFFRTNPNAVSLMGNHERKHIRSFRGETRPALSQRITRLQLGEAYPGAVSYLETFPYFLDHPEATLVHGFLEPNVPLPEQLETVLAGTLTGENHLKQYGSPWYELYTGEKPVIVGHLNYLGTGEPFIYRDRVFGIDTGCCRGGRLTAILLPEFRFFSVAARQDYYKEMKRSYAWMRFASADGVTLASLTWEEVDALLSARGTGDLPSNVKERLDCLHDVAVQAEEALNVLYAYIRAENARVLVELRAECPFDELPLQQQGSLYAARIGKTPLAPMLHLARKGQLTLEGLKRQLKTPEAVINFVARLGLLRGQASPCRLKEG